MINKIIKYINIRGFYLLIQDIQNSSSRSKQNFGLLRITMEDLKVLKKKRKEIIKKIEKLKEKLNGIDDKIAKFEGTHKELENIKEVSEKITKDIKKRPRPCYKENFNLEQDERNVKRQKRKKITPEIIQDEEMEDNIVVEKIINQEENMELLEDLEKELNEESQEYEKFNKRRQSKKEIEDLLEEISEEELKNLEFEKGIKEGEITEEISRLYYKLCKQEGILFEGKRGMIEIYFEFGRIFEEKINNLIDNEQNEEISAVTKIIDEIMKGGINHNRRTILRKSEKARKIYKIISADGGKEKIRRLKFLNSEDYMKFNFKEIEEWIKNY